MQACQHGHWEVVQTLVLSKATVRLLLPTQFFQCSFDIDRVKKYDKFWKTGFQIHRADYLNGGIALHFAALNGHSRCIRLLLVDYIPSTPDFWSTLRNASSNEESIAEFNHEYFHFQFPLHPLFIFSNILY